ncbi:MAG: hypothetical protein L3J71_15970 [Victivallaceae bacterium]|nr:hypothetical protein [Victivallaceae bacterium]
MSAKQRKGKLAKKNKQIDYVKVFNSHSELYTKPFSIEDIVDALWGDDSLEKMLLAANVLDDWLEDSLEFINIYDDTEDDDYWHHLPSYFEGNEFLVKPTEEELEAGILYPGHRFMPFISSDIHASEAMLFDEERQLTTVEMTKPLNELMLYHSIFGEHGMLEYFFEDNEDNITAIQIGQIPEFTVKVMNMKDFYAQHNFAYGDAILIKVESYNEGRLSLRYHAAADENAAYKGNVLKWCAFFGQGIAKTIEDNGVDMSMHDQLAATLLLNADFLLKTPVLHIGGFLALSKEYSLKSLNGQAIIWDVDSEPELDEDFGMDFEELEAMMDNDMSDPPDVDSLEGILRYMGFDFSEEEVEAYIRDELFHGGDSYKNVMKRCLDGRVAEFTEYQAYAEELDKHFSSIWDDISVSYNRFADGHNGKIRAKALHIKDQQTAWMRKLSSSVTDISDLPDSFVELAKTSGYISQILVMLNDYDMLSAKEYKQMEATLDAFEVMSESMMSDINADLEL